ncbi:hypothetical protein CEXT_348241 [Caerostris extrusa]|uniref:Uncharacterized protein n=1 Tax=Caerostris extrusa TaxID=172846 RepID=A0AAV4Y787_CAEEX|nr:hypothetical protein CEXT_348241 [Caerostris extrusa]
MSPSKSSAFATRGRSRMTLEDWNLPRVINGVLGRCLSPSELSPAQSSDDVLTTLLPHTDTSTLLPVDMDEKF